MTETTQDALLTQVKFKNVADVYTGLNREEIERIVDALKEENQIGARRIRAKCYRRYVHLRTTELYTKLVSLYTDLFTTSWAAFKHAPFPDSTESQANKISLLASNYVAAWFWDLQVTIRTAVRAISGTAFNQHFSHEIHHLNTRYDPFLQHLNSIIRPTHIQMALEDTLYIPIITQLPNWENATTYDIHGLYAEGVNPELVYAMLDIMDNKRNEWSTVPLSKSVLGRPGWLFDYRLGQAYAWFSMDYNYTREDLIAPHILGIPCTPRLAPRDDDDWQPFWKNQAYNDPHIDEYDRITPRNFRGNAEYRTIEHKPTPLQFDYLIPRSDINVTKRLRTSQGIDLDKNKDKQVAITESSQAQEIEESETEEEPKIPDPIELQLLKIVDWCYFARVVEGTDQRTRKRALRNFVFYGAHQGTSSLKQNPK
nr:coat protein [Partitiviridae sp.]